MFVTGNKVEADNNEVENQYPVHTLKCDAPSGFCYGNELNLNQSNRYFTPVSTIPAEQVRIIHLGGHPQIFSNSPSSVMHTLTSNLCQTFPNLKIIDAKYLGLVEIEQDALRECSNLEAIYLGSNKLEKIDQNLFKHNKNLEKIRLEDNKFTKIDLNLFEELRHLNELGFDGQLLDEFHVNKVRHRGIIKLVVRFNERSVIDLDEMGISEMFSPLSSFIPCYRDQTSIYIRLLESMFEPFAKMYCFERPGNWDQVEELIMEKGVENELSVSQNTLE